MDAEDHIQVEASSNMRASWNPRSGPTAPLRLAHTIAKGDDAVSLEAGGLLSTDMGSPSPDSAMWTNSVGMGDGATPLARRVWTLSKGAFSTGRPDPTLLRKAPGAGGG